MHADHSCGVFLVSSLKCPLKGDVDVSHCSHTFALRLVLSSVQNAFADIDAQSVPAGIPLMNYALL